MAPALSVVVAAVVGQGHNGKVDPNAPCQDQSDDACCYKTKTAPVLGGIDFVDLAAKKQGVDSPVFGSDAYTAELNGYSFHFTSQANADTFAAAPWTYAPACGGF